MCIYAYIYTFISYIVISIYIERDRDIYEEVAQRHRECIHRVILQKRDFFIDNLLV